MPISDSYSATKAPKRRSPLRSLPRILCDFNSAGWSGEVEDECYYSFDGKMLSRHRPRSGMRVFIYESSRDDLVMGCEARLEEYRHPVTDQVCWRLRPIANTGYLGQLA
jgi:hypothetical protein